MFFIFRPTHHTEMAQGIVPPTQFCLTIHLASKVVHVMPSTMRGKLLVGVRTTTNNASVSNKESYNFRQIRLSECQQLNSVKDNATIRSQCRTDNYQGERMLNVLVGRI